MLAESSHSIILDHCFYTKTGKLALLLTHSATECCGMSHDLKTLMFITELWGELVHLNAIQSYENNYKSHKNTSRLYQLILIAGTVQSLHSHTILFPKRR